MASAESVHLATKALIRHLEERRAHGQQRIWISEEARKGLNAFAGAGAPVSAPPDAPPPPSPRPGPEAAPAVVREETAPGKIPAKPAAKPLKEGEPLVPEGSTQREKLRWLAIRAKQWEPARELDSLRDTMVFAVGNPDADLMFVGEAPGAEEERQKEPFVGPAGQLLTKMVLAMGLTRKDIYISNIVKFRPALPNQGESNRKPTPEEMTACLPFIRAEIGVVQPKVIVALGATAAQGLLGEEQPVARMRNRFHEFENVPTMVTYHPSYLLRNTSLSERRKVWEDLLLVMEKLGLPISSKQRGYFQS